jgi:glycosyltransferase involved in cell wall biosynthesis
MSDRIRVIVPDSHDWTTLGTGGGIETILKMLVEGAERAGLELTLVCAGPREATRGSVHFLPVMGRADSEAAFVRRLRNRLRSNKLNLPSEAVVLANAEHYCWAFRKTSLPVVLLAHGTPPETLMLRHGRLYVKLFQRFIERSAVSRARRIIAVNGNVARYYLAQHPDLDPSKIIEIGVGLDLREFENRPRTDPFAKYHLSRDRDNVLFVGRLHREKNVRLFLQACDELVRIRPALQVMIIGEGPEASLVAEWMRSRPWIHWIERLPRDVVLDFMSESKALAVTSTYEGLPMVMLEALASALPVVSTDVGRAAEFLRPPHGRVVPASPQAFSEALGDVLTWDEDEVSTAVESLRPLIDFENTIHSIASILREVRANQEIGRVSSSRADQLYEPD